MTERDAIISSVILIITPFVCSFWLHKGFVLEPFFFAIFMVLILFTWVAYYFRENNSVPPSNIERVAASIWVTIRKLVCYSASVIFVFGGIFFINYSITSHNILKIVDSLILFSLAGFSLWVGNYGRKAKGSTMKEDKELNELRQQRYKNDKDA
jgi:hypothetical protein